MVAEMESVSPEQRDRVRVLAERIQRGHNRSLPGSTLMDYLEAEYRGLFCVQGEFAENGILCRVVQKYSDRDGLVTMIITESGISFAERMVNTLCGLYWYLTKGAEGRDEVFTISTENRNGEFAAEAFRFAAEFKF